MFSFLDFIGTDCQEKYCECGRVKNVNFEQRDDQKTTSAILHVTLILLSSALKPQKNEKFIYLAHHIPVVTMGGNEDNKSLFQR